MASCQFLEQLPGICLWGWGLKTPGSCPSTAQRGRGWEQTREARQQGGFQLWIERRLQGEAGPGGRLEEGEKLEGQVGESRARGMHLRGLPSCVGLSTVWPRSFPLQV